MGQQQHLTSRRGFVAAMGFGAVSLYGLWAVYGAAPGPSALFAGHEAATEGNAQGDHGGHGAAEKADEGGGHEAGGKSSPAAGEGGHGGHGAPEGNMAEEFERKVEEFVTRYRLGDGTVYPRRQAAATSAMDHGMMDHGLMGQGETEHGAMSPEADDDSPIDVYLLARRFSYEPGVLRLDKGVPYRFRMMAADSTHGASIHLGGASRIIRLRMGVPVEQTLTFHEPGSYLIYCTVYCGTGHDAMQGRIDVV
ncbi:MAG: hypothetical protein HZA67_03635 [Rhodospirillales bacterium]|nr:hypothetical protein [Rhodospirillales bacterium]